MSRNDAELEKDGEFAHRIAFERDGTLVLLEQTGFWNLVGGPQPYHDSVALSFFSVLDIRSQIENSFTDTSRSPAIKQRTADPRRGAAADKPRRSGQATRN